MLFFKGVIKCWFVVSLFVVSLFVVSLFVVSLLLFCLFVVAIKKIIRSTGIEPVTIR